MEEFNVFKKNYDCFNGFLSGDPEIKFFDSGKCKTKFSLPLKKKKEDDAVWLNCEAWGKTAERITEEYKKGDEIVVLGYFKESENEGKKYITFCVKGVL